MRRVLKLVLLSVGMMALAATPAGAHNVWSESSFSPWQGFRTKIAYSPTGIKLGEVRVEARRMPYGTDPTKGYYGFRMHYITDLLADNANGALHCIEAWMDFKPGAGQHRNPTVIRKCNFGGSPTSYHNGMTDVVLHPNYTGFNLNICQVYMHANSGVWDRHNCHGDDGSWPDNGGPQDYKTDNQLAACLHGGGNPYQPNPSWPDGQSNLTDTTWLNPGLGDTPGCMAYLHWV